MRKKLIITIVVLALVCCLLIGAIVWYLLPKDTEQTNTETANVVSQDTNTVVENNINTNNNEFVEKYAQYLRENIFENTASNVTAVFINIENDPNAIPVLAYKRDYYLGFLSLNGDEVQESREYYEANIRMLYNVEDNELNYFVEYDDDYIFVNDLVNQNSIVTEIDVDDETMYYRYINLNKMVAMNEINFESLSQDLQNLYTTYQNTVVIDETMQQTIDEQMQEIKDNVLVAGPDGISNANYTAEYGTYVCGDEYTFTMNEDSSAVFTYDDGLINHYEHSNSYVLEHDIINFRNGEREFRVIGDNQLQEVENDQIYNLQN